MSDVFAKRRPMIDLDEFERRLCRPCSTDQKDDDPLAELLRIIGDNDEFHETDFEPNTPLSATARKDAGERGELDQPGAHVRLIGGDFAAVEAGLLGTKQPQAAILPEAERSTLEDKRPNERAPLISGDFAAIEGGLLGAPREQATATVSETDMSNAFLSTDIGSQLLHQDNGSVSRHASVADGQNRARRPLYVMVAIVIVAMAGIAVSFKADSGAAKLQGDTADVPAQDAAILSKPPEPSPMALVNGTERTLDLPQVEEKTLPAESHAQIGNRPPAVPSAPAQAQTPAEPPLSMAAPIESDTMKTDLVRPDGTLLSNGAPPQANINEAPLPASQSPAAAKVPTAKAVVDNRPPAVPSAPAPAQAQTPAEPLSMAMKADLVRQDGTLPPSDARSQANINEAPLPASQSTVAAKVPTPKAVGRVAKPRKPTAARDPGRQGQPRQIANKAKAMPVSPFNTKPAPIGDPKSVTPTTQPSPGTSGGFGFVQSAVNSLTSATAKLLEWGQIETGSRP
jgi:hypothetical protein